MSINTKEIGMLIELPLFSIKYARIEDAILHSLSLYKSHLVYNFECYTTQIPKPEDEAEGWINPKENVYGKVKTLVFRNKIVAIESSYNNDFDYWTLLLLYEKDSTLWLRFQTEEELRKVEVHLYSWLLTSS